MRSNPFKGYGVALVTPFNHDGSVDFDSLAKLIDFQIDNGVDFICALGTTAETPTLEDAEYQDILDFIISRTAGRIPVMAGCGDNCTSRLAKRLSAIRFNGVQAILSCVPAYNKPSQEGIYQHFIEIAKSSPLPIVLYNVPGRTGVNMSPGTISRLISASDKFIAIKEASGNLQQAKELIDMAKDGFEVICGDDSLTCDMMRNGAAGIISVIGNAIPQTFSKMVHLCMDGDFEAAQAINKSLNPLYPLLFKEGSPCGIKSLLSHKGIVNNVLRLPMTPVSPQLQDEIINGFADIAK